MNEAWKILIAGDDGELLPRAQRALADCTFFGRPPELLVARSSAETIEQVLRHPDIAVLVADTAMEGGRAGLEAVEAIRGHLQQRRLRIVLRGGAPEQDFIARHDVHEYAGDTEFTDQKLQTLVHSALDQYQQLAETERSGADPDEARSAADRVDAELIRAMAGAVEARSSETPLHMRRVAEYARLLGRLAGLDDETADLLYRAAPLHDTGKIAIPDSVLLKPGDHTPEEAAIMRTHAELGAQLLSRHDSPVMQAAAIVAGEHHERWDGRGYPNGWRGEQIHIFGRITAVCDVFDALTHPRIYKDAWPLQRTLDYLREERGSRFDPALVDLFMNNLDQFVAIHTRLAEPPLMH